MRQLWLGIAWLACCSGTAAAQTAMRETMPELGKAWAEHFARQLGPSAAGYAWVVMRNGDLLFERGSGVAARAAGVEMRPMLPSTRMQIASASKPVTAMALLLAVQERGIGIDTSFAAILGDTFGPLGSRVGDVTIRQLLTHRSGWPFGYIYSSRIENTRRTLAEPIPNPPGETARYSNINYSLARTLLEIVCHEPYLGFVMRRMWNPSGVRSASLTAEPNDAYAHRFAPDGAGKPLALDFGDEAGAYGWYLTARELAGWADALRRGLLMPKELVARAFNEGLGWGSIPTNVGPAFSHQGQWVMAGNAGVRTAVVMLPDDVVAVLFINTNIPTSPPSIVVGAYNSSVPTFARTLSDSGRVATLHITTPASAAEVRYTVDGSDPTPRSPRFDRPLELRLPVQIRAQGFAQQAPSSFIAELRLSAPSPPSARKEE